MSSKTLCTYFLTLIINFQKETKTNVLTFHSDVSHFTAFSNYRNLQHFITLITRFYSISFIKSSQS